MTIENLLDRENILDLYGYTFKITKFVYFEGSRDLLIEYLYKGSYHNVLSLLNHNLKRSDNINNLHIYLKKISKKLDIISGYELR